MASNVSTLEQVESALLCDRSAFISPIMAYVVGFEAQNPFPSKFMYKGCARLVGKRVCCKSVEKTNCEHDLTGEDTAYYFRFDLLLTDGSMGGKPLKATIFSSAATLLGIGSIAFKNLSDDGQSRRVTEVVRGLPHCDISIHVHGGSAVVQDLSDVPLPQPIASPITRVSREAAVGNFSGISTPKGTPSAGARAGSSKAGMLSEDEHRSLRKAISLLSLKFVDLTGTDEDDE